MIVRLLATGPQTVTNVAAGCRTEIVTASHHLCLMKRVGLMASERDGRLWRYSMVGASVRDGLLRLEHPSGVAAFLPLG